MRGLLTSLRHILPTLHAPGNQYYNLNNQLKFTEIQVHIQNNGCQSHQTVHSNIWLLNQRQTNKKTIFVANVHFSGTNSWRIIDQSCEGLKLFIIENKFNNKQQNPIWSYSQKQLWWWLSGAKVLDFRIGDKASRKCNPYPLFCGRFIDYVGIVIEMSSFQYLQSCNVMKGDVGKIRIQNDFLNN